MKFKTVCYLLVQLMHCRKMFKAEIPFSNAMNCEDGDKVRSLSVCLCVCVCGVRECRDKGRRYVCVHVYIHVYVCVSMHVRVLVCVQCVLPNQPDFVDLHQFTFNSFGNMADCQCVTLTLCPCKDILKSGFSSTLAQDI